MEIYQTKVNDKPFETSIIHSNVIDLQISFVTNDLTIITTKIEEARYIATLKSTEQQFYSENKVQLHSLLAKNIISHIILSQLILIKLRPKLDCCFH